MKYTFILSISALFIGHQTYAKNVCIPQHTTQDATVIIQTSLDQCQNKVVELQAGVWLSGPLNLPNNTTLKLNKGSVLKANPQQKFKPAYIKEAAHSGEALIYASNVSNIKIIGEGTLDGNGQADWQEATRLRNDMKKGNYDEFKKLFPGVPPSNGMPRPWLFEFDHVKNSTIDGIQLINSPMWTMVIRNSDGIQVKNAKIFNPEDAPNTDGIDIVSSKNIKLSNLDIVTGDDNIAIKSGLDKNSLGSQGISENIEISNVRMGTGHGLSIGSETVHGVRNIKISNVEFKGTDNGIRIKSARDRGNVIENISAQNIKMDHVTYPIVLTAIYSSMTGGYDKNFLTPVEQEAMTATTPIIRNISIKNLTATNALQAGLISGLPESPIQNMQLQNIHIEAKNGLQNRYVQGRLKNVHIQTKHDSSTQNGPQPNLTMN